MVVVDEPIPVNLKSLSTQVLSQAVQFMPSPLVIMDTKQKGYPIVYANQAFYDLTGYNQEEVIGHNFLFLQGPQSDQSALRRIRRSVKNNQQVHATIKSYRKDGSMFWNDLMLSPLLPTKGEARYFLGVRQDITERMEYARDQDRLQKAEQSAQLLRKEKKQLMELNRAKDEFISLSSHQLRTPATSVKQYLGMILEGYTGKVPKHLQVFIKTAYESNDRQLTIINDLLRTAKLDSGRHAIKRVRYNVGKLVDEVVTELQLLITMRRQKVVTHYDADTVVAVDPVELKIALINLIENASKYSGDGTVITIGIRRLPKTLTIIITDTGVGINASDHKRIFDKFTRVDNEFSDTVSGNGLGLYFVKRIVRLHGGKLRLSSALGKGSTFTMILPI